MEEGTSKSPSYPGGTVDGAGPSASVACPPIAADPFQWDTREDCEVRQILDRIADKWSLLVIALLDCHRMRFTELRREIDGISQRMLTVTLRQLERDGLVLRTVYPVVPPRVEYELTSLGRTLHETVRPLVEWTERHRNEVAAARAAYDERSLAEGAAAPGPGGERG
ncbi:winged helix-turn-helix transcriptional regulator [Streptomyces sp. JNUCC 64]